MEFKEAHENWLHKHVQGRKGEARRRLEEGHGVGERAFLEKVWWPAVEHLQHLIPEYEVRDYADGQRFLDFAYIRGALKLCLEVDGYGPHWRDVNRRQFADQLMRQNHLILDGWKVLRFAYDDVTERPRRCQQVIQQALGMEACERVEYESRSHNSGKLTLLEREILHSFKNRHLEYITPIMVGEMFGVSQKTAYRSLHKLIARHYLSPAQTGKQRNHKYVMNRT